MCEVDWSALGTWAAVVVALGIALRDGLLRRSERRERAELAAVLLWPEVRRLLTGLTELRAHPVTKKSALNEREQESLAKILELLAPDKVSVSNLLPDLSGEDARQMAVALANTRHAYRHANDILILGASFSQKRTAAKQKAMIRAVSRARNAVVRMSKRTANAAKAARKRN